MLNIDEIPSWVLALEPEDLSFIKKFVISSGSLKNLAYDYQISYPTIRVRLDKLIDKIKAADSTKEDSYVELVKSMAIDEKFDLETAKVLIQAYKKEHGNGN